VGAQKSRRGNAISSSRGPRTTSGCSARRAVSISVERGRDAVMADAVDFSSLVTTGANGTCEMSLAVEGVHCAGCMAKIERSLKAMPGVTSARLNFTNRRLTVGWRKGEIAPGTIVETLEQIGYRA